MPSTTGGWVVERPPSEYPGAPTRRQGEGAETLPRGTPKALEVTMAAPPAADTVIDRPKAR